MSVTLWIDTPTEKTIELGPTLATYRAFSEMQSAAGAAWQAEYADLAGVLTQCEDQEDADPEWLADVQSQAAQFLKSYGDHISDFCHRLLATLAHGEANT